MTPLRSGAMSDAAFLVWRHLRHRLREPFPEVGGNSLAALDLGAGSFVRMLDAICAARRAVDVEMYLWENDALGREFVEALRRAAARGARVRVLADGYGAREVLGRPLEVVRAAGGEVRTFNPFRFPAFGRFLHRTHRKLLVVDGERAFCGGAGFSTHFTIGKRRELPWHDRMFEIAGPLVGQLGVCFEYGFQRWARKGQEDLSVPKEIQGAAGAAGTGRGRVLRGFPDGRDFQAAILDAVRQAARRIWIATPYFLPPRRLRRALGRASGRGVDVRLVLPAAEGAHPVVWYAGRRFYGRLLRRGVRIFEYGPSFYHAKLAVVDDDVALIGSSNLDNWSWRRNAELDLAFSDPESVATVAACFEEDRSRSREISVADHTGRDVFQRMYESAAGLLDPWL